MFCLIWASVHRACSLLLNISIHVGATIHFHYFSMHLLFGDEVTERPSNTLSSLCCFLIHVWSLCGSMFEARWWCSEDHFSTLFLLTKHKDFRRTHSFVLLCEDKLKSCPTWSRRASENTDVPLYHKVFPVCWTLPCCSTPELRGRSQISMITDSLQLCGRTGELPGDVQELQISPENQFLSSQPSNIKTCCSVPGAELWCHCSRHLNLYVSEAVEK